MPGYKPSGIGQRRERRISALLVLLTIALGLGSRRYGSSFPHFVAEYAGDTLWAAMVFFALAFLCPRRSTRTLAGASLAIAFAVEFSQLYHAAWIASIRSTRFGTLVLGQGFLWSDLACYAAGVLLAVLVDLTLFRVVKRRE